jgi:hypothetical protein
MGALAVFGDGGDEPCVNVNTLLTTVATLLGAGGCSPAAAFFCGLVAAVARTDLSEKPPLKLVNEAHAANEVMFPTKTIHSSSHRARRSGNGQRRRRSAGGGVDEDGSLAMVVEEMSRWTLISDGDLRHSKRWGRLAGECAATVLGISLQRRQGRRQLEFIRATHDGADGEEGAAVADSLTENSNSREPSEAVRFMCSVIAGRFVGAAPFGQAEALDGCTGAPLL